jgi:hypothetical protein
VNRLAATVTADDERKLMRETPMVSQKSKVMLVFILIIPWLALIAPIKRRR